MAVPLSTSARYICRTCKLHCRANVLNKNTVTTARQFQGGYRRFTGYVQTRAASTRPGPSIRKPANAPGSVKEEQTTGASARPQKAAPALVQPLSASDQSDTSNVLQKLRNEVNTVAASADIPDQTKVLEILEQSYNFANVLVFGQATSPEEAAGEAQNKNESIPLLSDLQEDGGEAPGPVTQTSSGLSARYKEKAAAAVCESIYNLLKDPKVTLDEDILSIYVRTICQLGHPEFLPEIFFLYANKPLPQANSKPIQYQNPSPNAAKNAIPQQLADVALDTAILQRDLPLAIAIIDTTVGTPAFRRNKFLRKGSIPLAAAGSTPLVAWAGAEWLAQWQDTFDPATSKYMTMMGAMAYIGTLGTVGFISLTTWNDHHDRVVWTPGTPLRQRWSREEERLYFDRLAVAWGFQRKQRRGEEMGEEWEALRDILGERSMILDKTDLLEGMQ